jgi:putative transposase
MQERFQVSVRRSCRLALLRPSVWYAKSQARDQSALRQRIREIAMNRPRFGYLRVHVMLRREGWTINKKRVWRLYRLDGPISAVLRADYSGSKQSSNSSS